MGDWAISGPASATIVGVGTSGPRCPICGVTFRQCKWTPLFPMTGSPGSNFRFSRDRSLGSGVARLGCRHAGPVSVVRTGSLQRGLVTLDSAEYHPTLQILSGMELPPTARFTKALGRSDFSGCPIGTPYRFCGWLPAGNGPAAPGHTPGSVVVSAECGGRPRSHSVVVRRLTLRRVVKSWKEYSSPYHPGSWEGIFDQTIQCTISRRLRLRYRL